jgi:uncharacterized SAM-binding protein YcdF (DUF218 family)
MLFHQKIFLAIGNYLVVEDTLQPADIIHIIAGEDHRTNYAIHLYQEGYADYIFFTGGWCDTHQYFHGEHGKELALAEGIPIEAILIDDSTVTSTYDEVERVKAYSEELENPVHSIIVVSDPHHMRRVRWIYRRIFGKQFKITMAPVPFESAPFQQSWWEDEDSRKMVRDEYIKFAYNIVRYQFSWGPFNDWLVSLDRE